MLFFDPLFIQSFYITSFYSHFTLSFPAPAFGKFLQSYPNSAFPSPIFMHVQVSSTLSCSVTFYLMPFLSFILRHVYIGIDISCSKPINSLVRIVLFTWSMFLSQFSCAKIPLLNAGVLFPDNSLISIYSVLCYTLLMKTQNIQNVSALLIL